MRLPYNRYEITFAIYAESEGKAAENRVGKPV